MIRTAKEKDIDLIIFFINQIAEYEKLSNEVVLDKSTIYDYLFNNKSLDDCLEEIKLNSRRFAKRQYTFFIIQFNTNWFNVNLNNFDETVDEVMNYIKDEDRK